MLSESIFCLSKVNAEYQGHFMATDVMERLRLKYTAPLDRYHIADEGAESYSREGGGVFVLLRFLDRHLNPFLARACSLQVCLYRLPVVPVNQPRSVEVLKLLSMRWVGSVPSFVCQGHLI